MEERRSTVIINDYSLPKFSKSVFLHKIQDDDKIQEAQELNNKFSFWLNVLTCSIYLPIALFIAAPVSTTVFASNAWVI
jgi:hypothetical protein